MTDDSYKSRNGEGPERIVLLVFCVAVLCFAFGMAVGAEEKAETLVPLIFCALAVIGIGIAEVNRHG